MPPWLAFTAAHGAPGAATFPGHSPLLCEIGNATSPQAGPRTVPPSPSLPAAGVPGREAAPGGHVRLEVSLSAPPSALKAPWTFCTCGEDSEEASGGRRLQARPRL